MITIENNTKNEIAEKKEILKKEVVKVQRGEVKVIYEDKKVKNEPIRKSIGEISEFETVKINPVTKEVSLIETFEVKHLKDCVVTETVNLDFVYHGRVNHFGELEVTMTDKYNKLNMIDAIYPYPHKRKFDPKYIENFLKTIMMSMQNSNHACLKNVINC